MRSQAEIKQQVLEALRALWDSDEFALRESERSTRLRPEILHRLLALVMTDDERAADLGLPDGCRVRESAKIIMPENLNCGRHVWIGENAIVDASGGLSIGDHTTIAAGAMVWSHTSVLSNLMGANQPGNAFIRRSATRIGSRTFIGGPAVVYSGVTVGDGTVVLPMSVVTRDVADGVIVAGAPAAVVGKVDEAWIARELARLQDVP